MPEFADLDDAVPSARISGVLQVLRGGEESPVAEQWASVCSGSGYCISACPEQLNPRFMLAMVRRTTKQREDAMARRDAGRAQFQQMSRGVRVLSRLQLSREHLERLSPSSHPERDTPPELVFYTGCNLLKTPHIGLLCLDVLDALQIHYEVHGGPSSCCGIYQARNGDDDNNVRQSMRTLDKFSQAAASEVLAWCPTCQIQFGETMLPIRVEVPQQTQSTGFDMTMFPVFLQRRLEALRPHFKHRVDKRVALHEHPGSEGVTDAVIAVLSAIPGLEVVTLDLPRVGYTLGSLAGVPRQRQALLAAELAAAEAAGVTTLAGIYHSDHREISAHDGQWPFEIVNFMELIGASMGVEHADIFKRLKTMQDVDAILDDTADMIALNKLSLEDVRAVVAADMLGEQFLPVDRAEHAQFLVQS